MYMPPALLKAHGRHTSLEYYNLYLVKVISTLVYIIVYNVSSILTECQWSKVLLAVELSTV